jgi:mono/diheme cytochrome c family protein
MRRLISATIVLAACKPDPFASPVTLGGKSIEAAQLNRGHRYYTFYCRTCHGENGDGRGPAAPGLETPPRDFRISTYKFAGAPEGSLPSDADLSRIVQHGLDGTAMLQWTIPPEVMIDIVQYIKTFAVEGEGWRDPDMETASLEIGADPWTRSEDAVARGRTVYHGLAACYSCHPAYELRSEIDADRVAMGSEPLAAHRPRLWTSDVKQSATYTRPVAGDPACEDDGDCPNAGAHVCRIGRCEEKVSIRPPSFTIDPIRVGTNRTDLYRVIAGGIPGTAMPAWKGSLDEKEIWAMAYYVESLAGMRNTPAARALDEKLRADPLAPMEPAAASTVAQDSLSSGSSAMQ